MSTSLAVESASRTCTARWVAKMPPALFDSSLYISALRQANDVAPALRRLATDVPLWLSSVVLEELYAGASDPESKVVERPDRPIPAQSQLNHPWPH
jgi:hypothetical protein